MLPTKDTRNGGTRTKEVTKDRKNERGIIRGEDIPKEKMKEKNGHVTNVNNAHRFHLFQI